MAKKKKAPPIRFAGNRSVKSIERSYEKLLLRYHKQYQEFVMEELKMVLPILLKESDIDDPTRLDADFNETIKAAFGRATARLSAVYSTQTLKKWAAMITARVDKTTKRDMDSVLTQAKKLKKKDMSLGGDEFEVKVEMPDSLITRNVNPYYKNVIDQQVGLITSIPEEQNIKLRKLLTQALIENQPQRQIAAMLRKEFNSSKSRARLIARDQVLKLNGRTNRVKQEALGIDKYVWRTVKDDRVRNRHKELDGRVFSWDDPPTINNRGDKGHPGDDFQCRCYAEAVLDDI
jgi:SPP1 gp7 family putative phage head morphogenesis protein